MVLINSLVRHTGIAGEGPAGDDLETILVGDISLGLDVLVESDVCETTGQGCSETCDDRNGHHGSRAGGGHGEGN